MGVAYERFLDHLRAAGHQVRELGSGRARSICPAHDGDNPEALSITETETRIGLKCWTQDCDGADILAAVGLTIGDRYNEPRTSYDYDDGRRVTRTPDKRFSQSGNTKGAPTLYRLSKLADATTIYLVEGEEDVHALEIAGAVATTAPMGAGNFSKVDVTPLRGKRIIAVTDIDEAGMKWATDVKDALGPSADLTFVRAAAGKDAFDHVIAGHGLADFRPVGPAAPVLPGMPQITLEQAHKVFLKWLGEDYDLDALDAVLAAAAVERLDGDPLWLLLISGSGNAKTETVQALAGCGALVTSTISSEGALLSATAAKEKAKDATGGLLRKIGDRGTMVIKDVTSILGANRDSRNTVLSALREVYDGRWSRNVGTDGGRTLDWSGRISVIGAVTTAWDRAHDVIATMGDRFVLVRVDSTKGRTAAGRKAIGNTGHEIQMRAELAEACAGVMAGIDTTFTEPTEEESEAILNAADLVTLSRTGVDYDYRGDVVEAHAPEMPTRFAKQLTQILRGAVALGMSRTHALELAIRCARDSMPPLRLECIDYLAANPNSSTADVRKAINKPRATVDRQLQALQMLNVLDVVEEETEWGGKPATRWYYTLTEGIEPTALVRKSVPDLSPHEVKGSEDQGVSGNSQAPTQAPTDISGTDSPGSNYKKPAPCGHPLSTPVERSRGTCGPCDLSARRAA